MRFKLGDEIYDAGSLDDLTLKMILELEMQSQDMGHVLRFGELEVMVSELDACKTNKERQTHPATPWVLAVTIWAARRLRGEQVTFEQAVDFPMHALTFIKDPQDRLTPANPTRAARQPRKASGRAVKPRPRVAALRVKTSDVRSIDG